MHEDQRIHISDNCVACCKYLGIESAKSSQLSDISGDECLEQISKRSAGSQKFCCTDSLYRFERGTSSGLWFESDLWHSLQRSRKWPARGKSGFLLSG